MPQFQESILICLFHRIHFIRFQTCWRSMELRRAHDTPDRRIQKMHSFVPKGIFQFNKLFIPFYSFFSASVQTHLLSYYFSSTLSAKLFICNVIVTPASMLSFGLFVSGSRIVNTAVAGRGLGLPLAARNASQSNTA